MLIGDDDLDEFGWGGEVKDDDNDTKLLYRCI